MTQETTRSRLVRALNLLLTAGVVYFAFVYGRRLLADADFSHLRDRGRIVVLACVTFGCSYLLAAWHWLRICRLVVEDTPSTQMLSFFASQPYKYLPTSLFPFSYRARYARSLGLPIKQSSIAQVIENVSLICSGVAVSAVFYVISYSYWLGGIVLLTGAALAVTLTRRDVVVPIPRTDRRIPVGKVLPNVVLMMGGWTVAGLAFLLVNYSLDLSVDPWLMISANAAAYVASILAVFAPGGIGVREVVLSLFSVSSSAVVLWRLVTFVADLTLGFGAIVVLRTKAKRRSPVRSGTGGRPSTDRGACAS